MVLKGYVKRIAELKKKTKEQLINYIIDKERKRDDKLSNYISRVVSLTDLGESWRGKNCELRIEIAMLKMKLEMIERENSRLIGEIKIKDNDLSEVYERISNHSENIENEVLKKFNQLKSKIIQELIEDKVKIIKEELKLQKDKDIIQIFEHLGVSKERLFEIIEKKI